MKDNTFYQESGVIGTTGSLYMIIGGITLSFILSVIYGYGLEYTRSLRASILLPVLYGGLIGFGLGKIAYWGKIRNTKSLLIITAPKLIFIHAPAAPAAPLTTTYQ